MTAAQHTLKRSIAPEGNTPGKPEPKLRSTSTNRAKKTLFGNVKASTESGSRSSWSNDEVKALVQYICLYWPQAWTNKWPVTKDQNFWENCAQAINVSCKSNRTGTSICTIVCVA